ncbi:alpha/beta hydrolase [bacterium]|nr:alpha/beta hydrolase [bacterium]
MSVKISKSLFLFIFIPLLFQACNKKDSYEKFYKRIKNEESYIGFFSTERKCISDVNDNYLKERRKFFLQINQCKEDPEKFIDPFIKFCKKNYLVKDGCEREWQKVLTILSYELYANKPIFEYSADNIIEHCNLVFAEYPNKKLELDLFLPEQPIDKPVPCIICVHGGGWRVNRRVWFEPFAKYLASKGFAAVTIDYRMLPAVKVIDCVYDTKAAVRWVRANAKKFNIDSNKIGAIGASAGAHLVALLATTADVPELEGNGGNKGVSSAVQAVVGIATPVFNLVKSDWIVKELAASIDDIKLISPYEHVSSNSAPILLIHGTADKTVDPQNSQDFYDKYKECGAYAEIKWIPDEDHGFYEGNDRAIELATQFFKKQFIDKSN